VEIPLFWARHYGVALAVTIWFAAVFALQVVILWLQVRRR